MQLIIDGHNLIPHLPGIALSDPDDESQLVNWLLSYCRMTRSKVTVFFDQAAVGYSGVHVHGAVRAHYVRKGRTADDAIIVHLKKLGKAARNYAVVSSDRVVAAAARSMHAQVLSSEAFAATLTHLSEQEPEIDPRSRLLNSDEVDEWQALFEHHRRSKKYSK
jgi:predicted RNA-binding protein with PIN domain